MNNKTKSSLLYDGEDIQYNLPLTNHIYKDYLYSTNSINKRRHFIPYSVRNSPRTDSTFPQFHENRIHLTYSSFDNLDLSLDRNSGNSILLAALPKTIQTNTKRFRDIIICQYRYNKYGNVIIVRDCQSLSKSTNNGDKYRISDDILI